MAAVTLWHHSTGIFDVVAVAAVGPFVMWNVLVWRQPAIMVVFGSVGKKHKQQYNHDELEYAYWRGYV